MADAKPGLDFFVSHATANRAWAEWIAVELGEAGYTTIVRSFDFRPGTDFVHQMHDAAQRAQRTIAVLSPDYLTSQFGEAEWRVAFAKDPSGEKGLLIPVRVQPGDPDGLLATRVYVDLVGVNETAARRKLLAAVDRARPRPTTAPYPGDNQPQAGAKERPSGERFPGLGPAVSNLPARNRTFSGRDTALLSLYNGLKAESAAAVLPTTAVHGLGGVGKSALALEYAYRYASDYDVIWWVNAEQPTSAATALAELGNRLGLPEATDQTDTIKQLFDDLRDRDRWLLIYDNAESPTTLNTLLPAGGGGHVLITSRWSTWTTQAAEVPLDALVRDESIEFLRRRISAAATVTSVDENILTELGDLLGDLPLALEEAAAYLDETSIHPAEYVDLLRTRTRELFGLDSPSHDPNPTHRDRQRVATVWDLSLERIRLEAPAAEELLTLLAFLAADVPRTLPLRHPYSLPQTLATAVTDPVTYNGIIAAIRRFSMVTATHSRLAMHRLVQAVIVARLTPADQRAWATIAMNLIYRVFPDSVGHLGTWADCEQLLPHLLAACDHARRLHVAGEQTGWLLGQASAYLRERGQYALARPLAEQALLVTQAALGGDDVDVAWRHNELGCVLHQLGDLNSARHHQEQALRVGEAATGQDHPDIAVWRGGLGLILRDLGDLRGACCQFEEALRIGEAALGSTDPVIGTRRNNLGRVLHDLGDLEGARDQYEQALRITEADAGPTHPDTAICRSGLGGVLHDLGDLDGARDQYERALRISQDVLGATHPTLGTRHNNLGNVLRAQGDLDGARYQYEQALRLTEATLGPTHPAIATWRSNLALVLKDLGDLNGARNQLEQAIHITEAAFGPAHLDAGTWRNNLGRILRKQGDLDGARRQYKQSLCITEAALGPAHPAVGISRNGLGRVLEDQGDFIGAVDQFTQALQISEVALGHGHPLTVEIRTNLARLHPSN